jgi:hypothetical protein
MCLLGLALATPVPDREAAVDLCGQRLFLIGDRNKLALPINLEQMEPHCNLLRQSQGCISNYSNTYLDGMAKQVTSLLVKGAIAPVNTQCDGETNRLGFIGHTQCYNTNFQSLHTCMENYIDNLQGLSIAPKDDKIPLTCCNYYTFRNCIIDQLNANGDVCAEDDVNYMRIMLDGFASEVLGLLCKHTPAGSPTCTTLTSPTKPVDMVRTKSILLPLINAFSNF